MEEVEIQGRGALPPVGVPGLAKAIGEGKVFSYDIMNEYKVSLYVDHKDVSAALKQAVSLNQNLSIEFVPDAIIFTDGSILK